METMLLGGHTIFIQSCLTTREHAGVLLESCHDYAKPKDHVSAEMGARRSAPAVEDACVAVPVHLGGNGH